MGASGSADRMSSPVVKRPGPDFFRDATSADRTKLPELEGKLQKLSTKQRWQGRYFALNNGFLNYYNDASKKALLGALDLSKVKSVEPVDLQSGHLQVEFGDGSTYDLRAGDSKLCTAWLEALEARVAWASAHPPDADGRNRKTQARPPPRGNLAAKQQQRDVSDEEDGDGSVDEGDAGRGRGGNNGNNRASKAASRRAPANSAAAATRNGGRRNASVDDDSGGSEEEDFGRNSAPVGRRKDAVGGGVGLGLAAGAGKQQNAGSGVAGSRPGAKSGPAQSSGGASSSSSFAGGNAGAARSGAPSDSHPRGKQGQQRAADGNSDEGDEETDGRDRSSDDGGGDTQEEEYDDDDRHAGGSSGGGPVVGGSSSSTTSHNNVNRGRKPPGEALALAARKSVSAPVSGRGGLGARPSSRHPERPRPPPAPTMEGWVKKKARTRFGNWQARFARLANGVIRFADDATTPEFSNSLSMEAVTGVRLLVSSGGGGSAATAAAKAANAVDRKTFVISTSFSKESVSLRAVDEKAAGDWVTAINASVQWYKTWGKGGRHAPAPAGGSGGKKAAAADRRGGDRREGRRGDAYDEDEDDGDGHSVDGGSEGNRGRDRRRGGGGRRGDDDEEEEEEEEEDHDSDQSEGEDEDDLPPPPKWFLVYERPDEAKWMNATQALLDKLFAPIYAGSASSSASAPGSGSGGGNADGEEEEGAVTCDGANRPILITKLAECVASACSLLEDRVMELRMRGRADIIKHFIQMFDLKFLQELTPLTTGNGPSALSSKQVLQVIDCIEGFISIRRRALGSMQLSVQEKRPGDVLRETRRDMIGRYMEVMAPKLHATAEKVLAKLFAERGNLVRRTLGTRVGTNSPTDLFNLMSEHLKIARDGGSYTLQRRLLSAVMGEVVFYAQGVLADLMDWWMKDAGSVDMDYVTAVINDAGVMLDHLEQLESYFAAALAKEAEATDRQISISSGAAGRGSVLSGLDEDEKDEFDREEEAQAREDLTAIEQDIPRAKSELLNSGCQLTGVLVDIICADFKDPLMKLFTPDWEKSNLVTVVSATVSDYFTESKLLLDSFFFDRLVGMVLAHLVEQYSMRLLGTPGIKSDKKEKYTGGFSSRFKLTEERLKRVVADIVELCNGFARFMAREDLTLITQGINQIREMLTIDLDNLPTVFELAVKSNPLVSTHVFLAFEKCVALREDLNKASRKAMLDSALKQLLEYGQPPEDDDDLLVSPGILGSGTMHGASMSQGSTWTPTHVTQNIYRSLFPNALDRAKVLFANWAPNPRMQQQQEAAFSSPVRVAGGAPVQASISSFLGGAAATGGAVESGDLNAFMSGGGGARRGKPSVPLSGASSASSSSSGGGIANGRSNARGGAASPAIAPTPDASSSLLTSSGPPLQSRGSTRRVRGGHDNDDDDDDASGGALGGGGKGGRRRY